MKDPFSLIRGEWIMETGHFPFVLVFFFFFGQSMSPAHLTGWT